MRAWTRFMEYVPREATAQSPRGGGRIAIIPFSDVAPKRVTCPALQAPVCLPIRPHLPVDGRIDLSVDSRYPFGEEGP